MKSITNKMMRIAFAEPSLKKMRNLFMKRIKMKRRIKLWWLLKMTRKFLNRKKLIRWLKIKMLSKKKLNRMMIRRTTMMSKRILKIIT